MTTLEAVARWVRDLVERGRRLIHRYEPVSRVVKCVNTLEAFDFSLILAAQAFLTIVPLLIVLAAFAPRLLGVQLSSELQASLGLSDSSLAFRGVLADPGRAARVGGALGFLLVLSAGASTARALQRGYERIWSLSRLGMLRSAWRSAAWLTACVLAFGLSGLAASGLKNIPGNSQLLLLISLAGAIGFWWWTPHLLLAARVTWRALLPTAVLTGGVLTALLWISPLVMPGFVTSSDYEFGPLGTVFVVMVWLTIVCSIIVFCAIAGQVVATEPRLSRLLHVTLSPRRAPGRQAGAAGMNRSAGGPGAGGASGGAGTEAGPVPSPATTSADPGQELRSSTDSASR